MAVPDAPPPPPPPASPPGAGGPFVLILIACIVIGFLAGQATIGFLVGLFGGIAAALMIWWRSR